MTSFLKVRFSLSNANSWRLVDLDFHQDEFYAAIVDYFEVIPGPASQERVNNLLAWWNRYVYINVLHE
jgi:hypothetical protein